MDNIPGATTNTTNDAQSTNPNVNPIQPKNMNPPVAADTLPFLTFSLSFLEEYLPKPNQDPNRALPHVTLTYASSLDSKISLQPGTQTVLSGPDSKLMTHYLRSRHDAILVGVGTVLADNPGLNCRLDGAGAGGIGQPRPVVIDPNGRWPIHPECRMLRTAGEGKGKAPWVVVSSAAEIPAERMKTLHGCGGDFLRVGEYSCNQDGQLRLRWGDILGLLGSKGVGSVMVEGGGTVISELLGSPNSGSVDSVITTVAPVFLGRGGVGVSPEDWRDREGRPGAALKLREVRWQPLGQDVIMCGRIGRGIE